MVSNYTSLDSFEAEKYQINYAFSALSSNDISNAQSNFLKIIDDNPDNIEALNSLGVIAYTLENYNDALYFFDKAIEVNPAVEESFVNRHFIHLAQNDVKSALVDISKAISISPEEPEYYIYREKLYLYLDDKENAMKDFFKADAIWAKDWSRNKIAKEYQSMSVYDYILNARFNK